MVLRKIATGGMAEVYLAVHEGPEGFEKPVAIKQILPHLASDEQFVRMFLDEARIAARLSHPNIVQIFDLGVEGQIHYLAMEYLFGESLARLEEQLARSGRTLPLEASLFIATNLCLALHHAHTFTLGAGPQPIVHRDVSPSNVLLSFDGAVKLADFGVAKVKGSQKTTTIGLIKGKVGYMAPEQILGEPIDTRTDLFALGIVLYELVTGRVPFAGKSMRAIFDAVTNPEPPAPASSINPAVPAQLDALLLRSLQKKPDDRFQTAADFLEALENAQRSLSLVTNSLSFGRLVERTFGPAPLPHSEKSQSTVSRILAYLDGESTARSADASGPKPGEVGFDEAPTLIRKR